MALFKSNWVNLNLFDQHKLVKWKWWKMVLQWIIQLLKFWNLNQNLFTFSLWTTQITTVKWKDKVLPFSLPGFKSSLFRNANFPCVVSHHFCPTPTVHHLFIHKCDIFHVVFECIQKCFLEKLPTFGVIIIRVVSHKQALIFPCAAQNFCSSRHFEWKMIGAIDWIIDEYAMR